MPVLGVGSGTSPAKRSSALPGRSLGALAGGGLGGRSTDESSAGLGGDSPGALAGQASVGVNRQELGCYYASDPNPLT
jgi:hypothetical protein